MNKENIKEIIFCNKNGKPAAFVKDYKNRFTEISVREGIVLAKVVDFRMLKSKEEIAELQREVISNKSKKRSRIGYALAAVGTAAALILGTTGAAALNANDLGANETGATQVSASTVAYAEELDQTQEQEQVTAPQEETFDSILQASESKTQREAVQMMSDYIDYFNGDFANNYKETVQLRDNEGNLTGESIEVKPALLWDYEVPALAIAYNDYTTRELQEIFNGTELDAYTLDTNYKNGTLQLFGAYVISDREHPVNLSALIESPEGKAFVEKYEDLFYKIKEAKTEEERIAAVNAFYQELYRDFPIDSYTREVGISHADSRSLILDQPYKLAITPMVTATEVMYQNLAIDHTLSDQAIAYFNDLGLCNLAYNSFEKAERALENAQYNEKYADYEKLSQLKINELRQAGKYVIDDAHRDLSLLTVFQENVNGHFDVIDGEWVYNGDSVILSTTTETHEEVVAQWSESHTETRTETTTTETSDREEAVERAGEEAVREAEDKVDEEIERENEEAREAAEREADAEQQRQQEEEDRHAEEVREEVRQDEEDMQQDIDDANEKIEQGGTVNEDDFGDHDVDFDDQHSDENGNLDDSVEEITTDGTGAYDANDPLPSPEAVEELRKQSYSEPVQESTPAPVVEETTPVVESTPEPVVESTPEPVQEDDDYEAVYYDYEDIDYEEEYSTTKSDEELVDEYVESLANGESASKSKSK